jgi:hypothetical protein
MMVKWQMTPATRVLNKEFCKNLFLKSDTVYINMYNGNLSVEQIVKKKSWQWYVKLKLPPQERCTDCFRNILN